MASGALPPGCPPVEIDGRLYWDGGLVSNTPLAHVLDHQDGDMLVFQVDLFPPRGRCRARSWTSGAPEGHPLFQPHPAGDRPAACGCARIASWRARVLDKLPPELRDDPDVEALARVLGEDAGQHRPPHLPRQCLGKRRARLRILARTMRDHWPPGREAVARDDGQRAARRRRISSTARPPRST